MLSSQSVRAAGVAAALALTASGLAAAEPQEPAAGPTIERFGPVFDVPDPDFPTPGDAAWRVVFDVSQGADDPGGLNRRIEMVARFLNMHARAGVPPERIHAVLVLHGGAGRDALESAAYRQRFEVDNPNVEIIAALRAAGVRVVLCGQTAASRGFPRGELLPGVEIALSAMTALVHLQSEGYALIAS